MDAKCMAESELWTLDVSGISFKDREAIGTYYLHGEKYELSEEDRAAFRVFITEIYLDQCSDISVKPYAGQPYESAKSMRMEVARTGVMYVSTEQLHNTWLGSHANYLFRAVHDIHHLQRKAGFSFEGECKASVQMLNLTDNPLFRRIIYSEIIGQVSAFYCLNKTYPNCQYMVMYDDQTIQDHIDYWTTNDK